MTIDLKENNLEGSMELPYREKQMIASLKGIKKEWRKKQLLPFVEKSATYHLNAIMADKTREEIVADIELFYKSVSVEVIREIEEKYKLNNLQAWSLLWEAVFQYDF